MSRHAPNLIGQRFSRLIVIERLENRNAASQWLCQCDCGEEVLVSGGNLRKQSKPTKSCGCLNRETRLANNTTHGREPWRLYRSWDAMLYRCKHERFHRYGGRRITVCKEWHSYESFRDWALANGYRDDLKIDRIDNDGNYEPGNCRWVDDKAQARNTVNNRAVVRSDGRLFATIAEAVDDTPGSYSQNITHACRGRLKSCAGFTWKYEDVS